MHRKHLLQYINGDAPVLEIGPLDRPYLKKPYDVYYADVKDSDEIRAVYANHGYVDKSKITPIDYVIQSAYADAVHGKKFGAVFSSHVIEHTGDIIEHLRQIGEILAEGGRYVLCVPDKRFTFDHFREVSPFRDAYDVHINGGVARLMRDLQLNYSSEIPNSPRSYISAEATFLPKLNSEAAPRVFDLTDLSDIKDTGHALAFTYRSFMELIRDCLRVNLLPFTIEASQSPVVLTNEFHVVLRRTPEIMNDDDLRRSEILKIQRAVEESDRHLLLNRFVEKYENTYFYGIAEAADCLAKGLDLRLCRRIAGLVVSDGYAKPDWHLPVYHMSELSPGESIGMVMCLTQGNLEIVSPQLRERGFDNVYELPVVD